MTEFGDILTDSAGPGGELGGTWASPSVDAVHSGTAHTDFLDKDGWTAGSVLFADPSGALIQDNTNLFFDETNLFLRTAAFRIGFLGTAGFYGVAHTSNGNNTDYALIQTAAGATAINSKSGQVTSMAIGGAAKATWAVSTLTLASGYNIALNTGTGTQIGTAVGQKVAFHGSTAVVQRAGAAQAAVATTAATNIAVFGYTTAAQADGIVTLLNELRNVLVEKGLMKGSA